MADKLLYIVGGPNGAGKSTLINEYRTHTRSNLLEPT